MSHANRVKLKPQNQKKNYQASLAPQTNEHAYLLPQENFQTLYGMANLADSEVSNKPSASYDVPDHMLHLQPPSQLYQSPLPNNKKKRPSTLYDTPKTIGEIESPRKLLTLFEAFRSS